MVLSLYFLVLQNDDYKSGLKLKIKVFNVQCKKYLLNFHSCTSKLLPNCVGGKLKQKPCLFAQA